jgi:S1-C subfamily serine protease
MRKIFRPGRVFFAALVIGAAYFAPAAGAAEPVNFRKIIEDYRNNALAADAKYATVRTPVCGNMASTGKDSQSYLEFEDQKWKVKCYVREDNVPMLLKLSRGDSVTVEGGSPRASGDTIIFKDCMLISPGGASAAPGQSGMTAAPPDSAAILRSLVIIEGKAGRGTGFVTEMFGNKVVITNCHVLVGNSKVKLFSQDGAKIEVKDLHMAEDRDIVMMESDNLASIPPLKLEDDAAALQIGTAIKVYGNKAGAGVHNESAGVVKGVGPQFFEVTASMVPGQSGGPIINAGTGKVAAVNTFITTVSIGRFTLIARAFGTRIDNLRKESFQKVDFAKYGVGLRYYNELSKANKFGVLFIQTARNMDEGERNYSWQSSRTGGAITGSAVDGLSVKQMSERTYQREDCSEDEIALVREWNNNAKKSMSVKNTFLKISNCIAKPVKSASQYTSEYGYINKLIEEQIETNAAILKELDKIKIDVDKLDKDVNDSRIKSKRL